MRAEEVKNKQISHLNKFEIATHRNNNVNVPSEKSPLFLLILLKNVKVEKFKQKMITSHLKWLDKIK